MDITYDQIIKYLCSNITNSNFPNKSNLIVYGNEFPEDYGELFGKVYYRYGVNTYDQNQNNISFYSSLLTIIDKKFITSGLENQMKQINFFKQFLINNLENKSVDFEYKSEKLNLQTVRESLRTKVNRVTMQFVVDLFDINLLLLDFKNGKTNILFHDDYCNPWKPFIIVAKNGDYFEPIINEKKKMFCFNDNIIKKLLKTEINYLEENVTNKYYSLVDNFQEIYQTIQVENELNIDEIKKLKKKGIIELILEEDPSHKNLARLKKDQLIQLFIQVKQG